MPTFGRSMLEHWLLDPDFTYLNHGTVGAPPRRVLQKQQALRDEMERQPARFVLRELNGEAPAPWRQPTRLREAIGQIAPFVGSRPEDLVFVPNVTTGLNAVLRSVPLGPGDEVLISDLGYGAITLAARVVTRERGATLRTVEMPAPVRRAADVVETIVRALTPRTKLLVVDHITAQTALVLPVAAIAAECHARGVQVLIDGAHAPGLNRSRYRRDRRRLVFRQPAQVGARAASVRHPLGETRAPVVASSSGRLVGLWRRLSRRVRAPRHDRSRPAISPHRRGSRCCASGISAPSSTTCIAWRWTRLPR